MTWVSTMFHQGGRTMFWVEYLGVAAAVVALLYLVKPMKWARWTTLAMIVAVLGIGVYGMTSNNKLIDDAIVSIEHETPPPPPGEVEEIRAQGAIEAKRPIEFAGLVAGILGVLLAAGEVRRRIAQ